MDAMSYFCRQNVSQISLEIVANCSHPSEILALESKMQNLIFVKYDKTQTELLFAQSLQSICSVYVDTPRVICILLVTVFFIIQPDIR